MTALIIRVECDDADFDWLRNKVVPVVEETVDEERERLDHSDKVEVSWEQDDS